MQEQLSKEQIAAQKEAANKEVKEIMLELEKDAPGITEGLAAALGAGVGGAGSLAALGALGSVAGFSAAGITSGLATAGAIVGGGMVAGIGVLAAPVALLAVGAYAISKRRKNAKIAAALAQAIRKLFAIQERLLKNAEYFAEEINGLKLAIEMLEAKQAK